MNARSKLLVLPALLAMAVGPLFADTKPAMIVQVVSTDDADAYAGALAKVNAIMKAKTGVERLRHTWVGDFAGEGSHAVFVVSQFPSAAAIYKDADKMKDDPELAAIMKDLKGMRHLGNSYLYKGVRLDGMYEGGAVFNTSIVCTDEDAYLKALDGLKAVLDSHGFKDAKVNLWRVMAGRKDSTHLVVIAFPSQTRSMELIDSLSDNALLKDWNVGAAKIRTFVSNGTYHEITK